MKLAKKTRKRFYEAEGEPVEHAWPQSAPEPFRGHRYPIYTSSGLAFWIRVESVKRRASGVKVVAVIDNDSNRPMIGLQGVRREDGSYESEPERLHKAYEDAMAAEARQKTARLSGERTAEQKREGKEARKGSSKRAERAIARHAKALERQA